MAQAVLVDLETLVCCGSEQKIAPCENTMLDNHLDGDDTGNFSSSPETPPDFPSESFYLSKEDEFEWVDRNAFYERKESTKGNSVTTTSNSNSTSQRFSMNLKSSKASIIGLPKPQKTCFTGSRQNCKASNNARFFPKRSRSSGKSPIPLTEPSSPKVSCIGRVRSKKGSRRQRFRHSKSRKGSSTITTVSSEKTGVKTEKIGIKSEKIGFWGNLKAVFSSRCRKKKGGNENQIEETSADMKVIEKSEPRLSTASEPAGMSELKRFTSGRRVESWVIGEAVDVEPTESDSVWDRRGLGPPKEVNCGRNWENVGPASV